MKIAGPPPPPALPRQDEPGPPAAGPWGSGDTFRFDELGLFGVKRADPAIRRDGGCAPAGGEPSPPAPPKVQGLASGPTPSPGLEAGGHPAPLPLPRPDRPRVRVEAPAPHAPPEPPGVQTGAPGELAEIAPGGDDEAPLAAGATPGARARARAEGRAFNLRLVAEGGQVSIAASAPQLDGEGRKLLRKLVREILAGHGLRLSEFRLNGVPLGADFPTVTGGSHGPRTR